MIARVLLLAAIATAVGGFASLHAQAPAEGGAGGGLAVLTGRLADEAGQPLAHREVQACMTTVCFFGETGADGRFRFEMPLEAPVQLAIKTPEAPSTTPPQAAALAPVRIAGDSRRDVGTVYVPALPGGPVSILPGPEPQTVQAGDGLELTIRRPDLVPAAGKVLGGVAARRIQPAHVPPYELPNGETVIAVYALHPFAAASRSPMAVRMPSSLPAGSRVWFRTIHEIDGTFSEPVPGRATGTHVATDAAAGITELTHLVITR